jgi:CubicO group peptidase (beta-lactamase class C family)
MTGFPKCALTRPERRRTPASCPPGLIIESLGRRPLHEAYRDLVPDPAGMSDTWLESSREAPRHHDIPSHGPEGHDITDMDPHCGLEGRWADEHRTGPRCVPTSAHPGQLSTRAWSEMTRWRPGPEGYYDDYGLGFGRYRFPAAQVVATTGSGAHSRSGVQSSTHHHRHREHRKVDRQPLLHETVRSEQA